MLYTHNHNTYNCTYTYTNICGNNQSVMNDFNKRTNTLLYKNINLSHFILERVMFVVWEMSWRRGQTAILTQVLLVTIAALLPHLGLGCSTMGHRGPQSPQSTSWFSLRHLVSNWLKPPGHLVILLFNVTCFRCSSAYLHRCISWLTAQSRVNI